MEPSSEEGQTGCQDGQGIGPNFPLPLQRQSERVNGEGRQARNYPEEEEEDASSPAVNESPSPDLRDTAQEAGEDVVNRGVSSGRPGDDEFENFHRSFTIATNPMESLGGGRGAYGPGTQPESSNGPDVATSTTTPSPTPVNPAGIGPQEQPQPEEQQPPSSPPPPTPQNKEDPTVVQARRSMMRRTGDRHARGKLPEPKEGRFLPPDCSPLEPQIPAPRSSKRYTRHKQRPPDAFEGYAPGNDDEQKPLQENEYVVSCRGCELDMVVRKAAVVVRCKNCNKVSPASALDRFGRSQFAPS